MRSANNKTVLVTGGSGFIGSHLCRKLLDEGNDVLCVDNLFTGSKENIRDLLAHPRFEFMRFDNTFPLFVEVDQIARRDQHAGARQAVKAKILQASTSEVYGNPEVHPQPESYWGRVNPIGPWPDAPALGRSRSARSASWIPARQRSSRST